jgi:hypothetical protein
MVLLRAASNNQETKADVLIIPQIAQIRPDRLNQGRDCQQKGEEAARAKIDEIKQLVSDRPPLL